MHILYIKYNFPLSNEPGPKRHLDIINELHNRGHKVTVITGGTKFMCGNVKDKTKGRLFWSEDLETVSLIRVRTLGKYKNNLFKRFLSYLFFSVLTVICGLKLRKIDVILTVTSPITLAPTGYILSNLKSSKLILEVNDLPETVFALGHLRFRICMKLLSASFRFLYRRANKIITITPGAREHLRQLGVSEKKIKVITNWIAERDNSNVESTAISDLRQKLGWNGKFVILYSGSFGKAYDLKTFIRAAKELEEYSEIIFALMGEGQKGNELKTYCEKNEISNCQFIPAQPREKLSMYIQAADVCTNLFYQGQFWNKVVGHKIFDYLENGKPVIFAGGGDTADLLKKSGGGIVVDPEDPRELAQAILNLRRNKEKTNHMGLKGREYLTKNYSKRELLDKYIEFIIPSTEKC